MQFDKKIIIGALIIIGLGFAFYSYSSQYLNVESAHTSNAAFQHTGWEKMEDTDTYAKNYQRTSLSIDEVYPQVVTVYEIRMSDDRKQGIQISKNEWLELFIVHPSTVTVQIRRDKGSYWVLSRQTFSTEGKLLQGVNPEESEDSFRRTQFELQNEIDTTRHLLATEF